MNCEHCDRSKVLRAYCYFKLNPQYFKDATGKEFNTESFINFATEMQLSWSISLCRHQKRTVVNEYWSLLKNRLIDALYSKEAKHQSMRKNHTD